MILSRIAGLGLCAVLAGSCAGKKQTETPTAAPAREPKPRAGPIPGQMTEQAKAAKQLFDHERWSEAVPPLRTVASGETADDAGNRQASQYLLAVALYRMQSLDESLGVFLVIAEDTTHWRHRDTLLWLATFAAEPGARAARANRAIAAHFSDQEAEWFNNSQQREVYERIKKARSVH